MDAQTNVNANAGDSKTGQDAQTTGNVYAESSNEGEASQEGKAYEITPESKISKEITDTSGVVVLSIVAIMGCLIYGYWRRRDMEY